LLELVTVVDDEVGVTVLLSTTLLETTAVEEVVVETSVVPLAFLATAPN